MTADPRQTSRDCRRVSEEAMKLMTQGQLAELGRRLDELDGQVLPEQEAAT